MAERGGHAALTGTIEMIGAWLSLVERLVRDQEAGGSNPLAPTIYPSRFQIDTGDLGDLIEPIEIGTVPVLCPPCATRARSIAASTVCACG